jgi:ferredoxin/flavodoxin
MKETIGLVYFSATNNTRKVMQYLQELFQSMDYSVKIMDITLKDERAKKIDFSQFKLVIFGFPIYGRKPPKVVREWFDSIQADERQLAGMLFTYGGVMRGNIHHETKEILKQKGFQVIGSAEILAKHSFNVGTGWSLLADHPNEADFTIVKEYAEMLIQKISQEEIAPMNFTPADDQLTFQSNKTKKEQSNKKRIVFEHPSRKQESCSMCLACEEQCPTGAFNAVSGKANTDLCIKCMRCVTICPDEVITINDLTEIYRHFCERLNLTEELLASRKSQFFI